MPIMLCTHDRCLWVATMAVPQFEDAVHLCCSLHADLQTSLGAGEPHSSLRGCSEAALMLIPAHLWQGLTTAVHDRLLGRQLWKRLGCCREGRRGGTGWRTLYQFSSGDINLASNHGTSKEDARLLPASRTLSPHPFFFPLLPRRGADVAHSR